MKTSLKIAATLTVMGLASVAAGRLLFRRKVDNLVAEQERINSAGAPMPVLADSLPLSVRRYLHRALPPELPSSTQIVLTQRGEIQIEKGKWSPFTATQHIFANQPGFIWTADLFPVYVRDSFLRGQGETLVSLLGLRSIGRDTGPEMNQGALQRYIGELCWNPAAFLDKRLSWKELRPDVVEVTLSVNGHSASGLFTFDDTGLISQFETVRYRTQAGTYKLERWRVTVRDYRTFAGVLVPATAVASWRLPEGDFDAIRIHLVTYAVTTS